MQRASDAPDRPLGGIWNGAGVDFAVFSAHARLVELCLFDRLESADEFDSLVRIVEAGDADVRPSMLPRPGDKVPPTWLYRRAHWRPEWAEQPRR